MSGTTVTARVALEFDDAATAQIALASLAPENGEVLTARLDDRRLILEAPAASIGSLVATLEDAFACMVAASASVAASEV